MPGLSKKGAEMRKALRACSALLICLVAFENTHAEERGSPDADNQFKMHLAESEDNIDAWSFEYESQFLEEEGELHQERVHVHRVISAEKPNKYYHWSTHESASYNWKDDPMQQRLVVNGSSIIVEHPFNRSFQILVQIGRAHV